jgi:hypothetical protein
MGREGSQSWGMEGMVAEVGDRGGGGGGLKKTKWGRERVAPL